MKLSGTKSFLRMQRESKDCAFTLPEIFITLGIIALLATLLFPLIKQSIERAEQVRCINNLKQIFVAHQNYAGDHNGVIPQAYLQGRTPSPWWHWIYSIQGYFDEPPAVATEPKRLPILRSPAVARTATTPFVSITYSRIRNSNGADSDLRFSTLQNPANYILHITGNLGNNPNSQANYQFSFIQNPLTEDDYKTPSFPYSGRANVLFADGSVRALLREEITFEMCNR